MSKYYYKGMLLTEYCRKNDIGYTLVVNRVNMLKNKYPNKTIEELIDMSINYEPYKYNYNGTTLKKYCINNGINYDKVIKNMKKIKNNNPDIQTEKLIKLALDYKPVKYMYNGISLKQYCDSNDICYSKIKNIIYYLEKQYPKMAIDEIVKIAMKDERKCKYYYNGKTLRSYCDNQAQYISVYRKVNKLINKYKNISVEELILVALNEKTLEEVINASNEYKDMDIKQEVLEKRKGI